VYDGYFILQGIDNFPGREVRSATLIKIMNLMEDCGIFRPTEVEKTRMIFLGLDLRQSNVFSSMESFF
jgi:hypothetical protein